MGKHDASCSKNKERRPGRGYKVSLRLALALIALTAVLLGARRFYQDWEKRKTISTRVYAVADLAPGNNPACYEPLITQIKSNVEESSWSERGGTGTITPFFMNRALIVRNHQLAHEQIEQLFRGLRRRGETREAEEGSSPESRL